MFDRFNDSARRVIARSADEARALNRPGIGTDHLLLALTAIPANGEPSKAWTALLALVILPGDVREKTLEGLTPGTGPVTNSHLPFSSELKRALQATIEAADTVGSNHVGPQYLLAGLARDEDSQAGAILAGMGITYDQVLAVIKDSAPALSPTASRICDVYLPVGKSIFKNGAKVYPDLASAQAAHPDEEIAPFAFPLHEGEFFDIGITAPRFHSWGMFASYPDAFAAAANLRNVQGADVQIRIMVPSVQELRGKDSRGNDIILGRNIEYTRTRIMSRLWEAHNAGDPAKKEGTRV